MKKKLVQEIRGTAQVLPERFEKSEIIVTISGSDANLCVVGGSPYDPKKKYQFSNLVISRINHEERMKDGVKREGEGFIARYITSVQTGVPL